ncbi:MAG TPA: squalene/phytoene synthase family protein [Solirubrobacteraceae bacterium]|nr:squalene/phytoene synthase family protein [Solirubrobacteraceae bacterium]
MSTAEGYAHCESLTRGAAANFYYGIRLLPREKRLATCAVYAFARRVDDIGDGDFPDAEKRALLESCERSLRQLTPASVDPVTAALADARARFDLPLEALEGLLAGVRMDVDGTRYDTFEELLVYCRCVAGTIGRLCLAIFGVRAPPGAAALPGTGEPLLGDRESLPHSRHTAGSQIGQLADDLGVAMQLTNILRDVCEDARRGRVYVPGEDLRLYRLSEDGRFLGGEGQMDAMMRFQARRAGEWFERGLALVPLLDRRSGACVLAMASIYRGVLERIVENPEAARRERVSLSMRRKGWLATRSLATAARS